MIAVLAAAGLVAGAVQPWLLRRIPDRSPPDGGPTPRSYRELAAARGLAAGFAAATGMVWALLGLAAPELGPALPAYLLVGALGVVMSYVDVREHRLPDRLTIPSFAGAALILAVVAVAAGEWGRYGQAWVAAAASVAFYSVLALARPGGLGLGDVKLSAVVGLVLGWLGWPVLVVGVVAGFGVGALASVVLIVSGRAGRRSALPFGPPMLVGMVVATVWGEAMAAAYLAV